MATADDYAAWIVKNSAKRGTPEFDTVAQAYQLAKQEESTATFQQQSAPLPQEPSLGEQLVGAGETALTLLTGATGGTFGTIVGTGNELTKQILSGEYGTPEAVKAVEEAAAAGGRALTYAPRTEAGQEQVQAVGEKLTEILPPVLPMIAAPRAITQALRSAAPITQATAQRGAAAVQQAGRATGQAIAKPVQAMAQPIKTAATAVRETLGIEPTTPTAPRVSVGAAATPEAQRRVATAEALPVPVTLTRGAATREAGQLAFEKEQMKGPLGEPLRSRAEENNLQALQNFDAIAEMTDAQLMDMSATGSSVVKALSEGLSNAKAKTRVAYQQARKSPEASVEVDPGMRVDFEIDGTPTQVSVIDYLNGKVQAVPSAAVTDSVRAIMKKLDIATEDADGNLVARPATVGKMEDFRREISGIAKFDDAAGIRDETILKKLIDLQTEPLAGDLYKKARALRTQQARKYENRAIVARLVKNRKGMDDPQVAADQVFAKSILNSSPEEITFLKRVLLTSGADGKQAFKELQGATVRHIRDEATKGMGMDSNDNPLVSPAKLHQTIRALDSNGRLDVMLGKQNAAIVRDLNDTVRYVSTVPPGTLVNSSGTAGTLMAAIAEAGATGALTGLPVPIATGVRQIIKMRKEGRTKAQINDALNALPEASQVKSVKTPAPTVAPSVSPAVTPIIKSAASTKKVTPKETYKVFRGISPDGPNDFGVAGKGEYTSGRRQAAEAYAGRGGKIEERVIELENPLKITYKELNNLQTKLYGKPLTGFEKDLSDNFDAYLRKKGYDGVVIFDPEMSSTIPEEVVKLSLSRSQARAVKTPAQAVQAERQFEQENK
jgi:hypothetical protein